MLRNLTSLPLRRWTRLTCTAVLLAVAIWPAWSFAAGVKLDHATLIEGLAKYGMSDLLDHFTATEMPSDPVLRQLVEIARHRIKMDYGQTGDEQLAAFEKLTAATRKLITQHADHEQRPLWQTDLADLLLTIYLPKMQLQALDFCEFGVPTPTQLQARDQFVPEAFELLSDADLRFFQLNQDLPRDPDHFNKRVATGLWDRMMEEYYKTKTQYLLGLAAYHTSQLGLDHPYYQNLGQNPRLPRQKKTPDQEQARLLDLAIEKLGPFAADRSDPYQIRLSSMGVMGRAMLHQPDNLTRAREQLESVIREQKEDAPHLLANLAKAVVLDMDNQHVAALDLLRDLSNHPMVKQYPLYRLLVIDLTHRLMLTRAQAAADSERAQAVNQAYTVYEQLLKNPALEDNALWMRDYVYRRWRAILDPEQDVTQLPPVVVAAVGEISRMEGQNLIVEALELAQQGQDQAAADLRQQAFPKLDESIRLNKQLLNHPQLSPATRASAMFNLGWAMYFRARDAEIDTALEIQAARVWTDLADQLPTEPNAEEAITFAVAILLPMYDMPVRPPEITEAYERACRVLFEKFPAIEAADNQRLYYAFHVLSQRGKYQEAADILQRVPPDHPDYFVARREMLLCLKALMDRGEKPLDQESTQQRLVETAEALIREIDQIRQPDPAALSTKGWAKLMLVDVAMARNDTDRALSLLEGFEAQFEADPELVRQALQRGIVALAHAERFDDVVIRAKKMMQLFPDDASIVIDEVLTDLDRQIDALRFKAHQTLVQDEARKLRDQAMGTARSAEQLARLLRDWAIGQNLTEEEMLFYDLLLAKAVRMAGKPDGAIDLLKPILDVNPQDPQIMHHMAESLFVKGDKDSLIQAATLYYDTLITGLDGEDDPQLKKLWWNAWMRRLQVSDQLNEGTADIQFRVRQLEVIDPSLGGEPYRSELKRLELKHAQ